MGGVNTSPDYVETMGLGYSKYEGESEGYVVTITQSARQGGIVSSTRFHRRLLIAPDLMCIPVYYLGTLIGCLIAGITGDRLGRLKTMMIGCFWVLLGAALQCSSQNLAWYVFPVID